MTCLAQICPVGVIYIFYIDCRLEMIFILYKLPIRNMKMKKSILLTAMLGSALFSTQAVFAACEVTTSQDRNGDGYDDSFVSVDAKISSDSAVECDGISTVGSFTEIKSGSRISRSTVGSRSWIVNGLVSGGSSVGSNAVVNRSEIWEASLGDGVDVISDSYVGSGTSVDDRALIVNSALEYAKVGVNTRISGSLLKGSWQLVVGDNVEIVSSDIRGDVTLEDYVLIRGAEIYAHDRPGSIHKGSKIYEGAVVNMGFGQTIANASVIGKNAKILHGGGFFSGILKEGAEVHGPADIAGGVGEIVIGMRSKVNVEHIAGPVRIGDDSWIGVNGIGRIKKNVAIGDHTEVVGINIDEGVTIGSYVRLGFSPRGNVGARTSIQGNVVIDDHIVIGEDVTIREGAQIGRDVVIGNGAIVGAGVVVPDRTVIAANAVYQ